VFKIKIMRGGKEEVPRLFPGYVVVDGHLGEGSLEAGVYFHGENVLNRVGRGIMGTNRKTG